MTGSRSRGPGREDGGGRGLQKELTPFEAVVLWLGVKRRDASEAGGSDGAEERGGWGGLEVESTGQACVTFHLHDPESCETPALPHAAGGSRILTSPTRRVKRGYGDPEDYAKIYWTDYGETWKDVVVDERRTRSNFFR
ncbi:unnamed protein product [Pleuronectes platessa]|uniref:Uncharacterized protein n=1 Tax=Pleuronectes platessa TaxID=8262 RepID=A0A9N7UY09_PLEPL|nr:unnamed protein product [Pleuronectes platessa]